MLSIAVEIPDMLFPRRVCTTSASLYDQQELNQSATSAPICKLQQVLWVHYIMGNEGYCWWRNNFGISGFSTVNFSLNEVVVYQHETTKLAKECNGCWCVCSKSGRFPL